MKKAVLTGSLFYVILKLFQNLVIFLNIVAGNVKILELLFINRAWTTVRLVKARSLRSS